MKKLVFIIPYFGKFNNYFQLFLNSCAKNKEVDWIIYTDDKTLYEYPKNIIVRYTTFNEIKEKIQNKINYDIALERAYKLCDFRPIYGYIFSEEIKEYEYWGYCDTDMIWGRILEQIGLFLKKDYDKIFFLGHCSVYKNSLELNKFIETSLKSNTRFKEVYSREENCSFDEEFKNSINNIFIKNKKTILLKELEANIYTKSSNFNITRYDFSQKKYIIKKRKNSFFLYENGKINQYYTENNEIKKEEFLYIHLQSRKMDVKISFNEEKYKIIPNAFEKLEYENIDEKTFYKIKKKNLNLHYFRLRSKNLKNKIIRFFNRGLKWN
ncbi:DUF6625 family protein [Fusobacterium sp.]|uniref:DUF6625 family protein n=1 Tax=Fusobacterium sp. TaxID=68766 RepID=UPI00261C563C|nr:DUF6625 family protein [Fusobacterium sp.]